MGEFREIVDAGAVGQFFALLAILAPLLGLGVGAALGARKQAVVAGALRGGVIGLLGPLNWLLWKVYNALTDRNGLDSVPNLEVNLALFVVVGAGIGVGVGLWQRRHAAPKEEPKALSEPPQ
jgi:hypothetical protein